MNSYLNNYQLEKMHEILEYNFYNYDVVEIEDNKKELENYTELFIVSKKVEGCSDRTLNYYQTTIVNMLDEINMNIKMIDTNDLRSYLTEYQKEYKKDDLIRYIDISSIDNNKNIMTGYTEYLVGNETSRAQQCLNYDDIVVSPVRLNFKK